MAVFQISRIQLRRGKKNQGTGIPQLASGELAWAIDTQELFIGNGAISEGAPYVGNTKILTNKDNLLEIAAQYQYKYDAQLQYSPVKGTVLRTLQSKLDDGIVNARNFGIVPSSELPVDKLDQTEKIQQAFDSIAAIGAELEFDPGEYQFSQTLTLPSFLRIKGAGQNKTVFKFTGTGVAFDAVFMSESQSINDTSIVVVNNNSTPIRLPNVKKQNYKNLRLASTSSLLASNNVGIRIVGNNSVTPDNKFFNIDFDTLTYGVHAENNAVLSSFTNSTFENLHRGVFLKNASYFSIEGNLFNNIREQALYVEAGTGNASRSNTFKNVGMSLGSAVSSVITFLTDGNTSSDDIFERRSYLENNLINPYVPDLAGTGSTNSSVQKINLPATNNPALAFRLPLNAATAIKIDYIFHSSLYNQIRKGTIDLVVDRNNNKIQLIDDYELVGSGDAIIFTANLETVTLSGQSSINVRLNYTNSNPNDVNTFTYTYSILS